MRTCVTFVVLAAAGCLASGHAAAGWLPGGDNRPCAECEPTAVTPSASGWKRSLFPFSRCSSDDECQCHSGYCCSCGKKKPKPKKKCCLFECFHCAEPPRGEAAFSIPARIERNAFQEAVDTEQEKQEAVTSTEQRIDVLERDLTRLTIVVEKVAESQQKQQQDLTRATLILERLASDSGK